MKWFSRLFKRDTGSIEPILGLTEEELEEGKHVIHIVIHEKEVTLSFTDSEMRKALKRGEKLNLIPREE